MYREDRLSFDRNLLFGAALVAAASFACATSLAFAADGNSPARERYLQERADCMSGRSHQAQDVCLREAGAAYDEARRGALAQESPDRLAANALARCAARPPDQKDMCERMARGEGTVTGSVEDGGFIREIVIRVEHDVVPPGVPPGGQK